MHSEAANSPRALVVEDDAQCSYLLRFILEREGYGVEVAPDGRRAQQRIEEPEPPALVMLDVMLPYLDGFQLIGLMRGKPAWKNVPIIMLSGKAQESDIVRALDAGANDYVVKPFKFDELRARIKRLVKCDTQ
jgi:DNA-binding response OmpR family regulator